MGPRSERLLPPSNAAPLIGSGRSPAASRDARACAPQGSFRSQLVDQELLLHVQGLAGNLAAATMVRPAKPATATVDGATRPTSSSGPSLAPDGNTGLRVGDFWYGSEDGKQFHPTKQAHDADEKARLSVLLVMLEKGDPIFYAAIKNENVVVACGSLPAGNVGRVIPMPYPETSATLSCKDWFIVDESGTDLSHGLPDRQSSAWRAALATFAKKPQWEQDDLEAATATRLIGARLSAIVLLDLAQIKTAQDTYDADSAAGKARGQAPSALAFLRHEAGHFLFDKTFAYDDKGNLVPSPDLPDDLMAEITKASHNKSITTELRALSEFAAEDVEEPGALFNWQSFMEENDPRFGVSGYRDSDGNPKRPQGFGIRVVRDVRLHEAKKTVQEIGEMVHSLVFIQTVVDATLERRRFNVVILAAATRKAARDEYRELRRQHVQLQGYPRRVVAYK